MIQIVLISGTTASQPLKATTASQPAVKVCLQSRKRKLTFLFKEKGGVNAATILFCFCLLDWIQAVQALMILSVLFCFCSLIAFLYQLFRLVKGGRFFFTAIFQILASEYDSRTEGRWGGHTLRGEKRSYEIISLSLSLALGVFVMCGAIIYTVMSPDNSMEFGYAYVLAWVAFPLSLISGLIYIVLRKKE